MFHLTTNPGRKRLMQETNFKRMKHAIKIYQLAPKEAQTRFAIAPYGRYLNTQLQKATAGQLLDFCVDWRKDRFILIRKAVLKVNSGVFTMMLKHIYGDDASWERLAEQWRSECIVNGLGSRAFDEQSVLLLEVKKFNQEEYDAEIERIRKAEERERILAEIKNLTYKHPAIKT